MPATPQIDSLMGSRWTANVDCNCYDAPDGNLLKTLPAGSVIGTSLSVMGVHHFFSPDELWIAFDNKDIKAEGAFYVLYTDPGGFTTDNGTVVVFDPTEVNATTGEHDVAPALAQAAKNSVDWFTQLFGTAGKTVVIVAAVIAAIIILWLIFKIVKRG